MTNKKLLSERDICTKYITPALQQAGWNIQTQVREEVSFTDGRIYVKGNLSARGKRKRADYILYYKPNIPIAIIEAEGNIITDYNKPDHPLMGALDKSAQLANAVGNLSKVPGLSKVVHILEKKSDKILSDTSRKD